MNTINRNSDQFLASINLLQARADRAQNEISSGVRVSKASDDPAAVSDILSLEAGIDRNAQVQKNLGSVKAEVDSAESSLGQAVNLLQNAVSLGAQGANTIMTAQQRQSIAQQVQGLLEQMVGLSRTQSGNDFVFSGDAQLQPAYQVNLQNPNGVDRLVAVPATRLIQDANGTTFSVSHTAQDIFDHRNADDSLAGDNAFAALNQLRVSLQNDDSAGIANAVQSVKAAQDWVGQQLGFYGAVQNRVASATLVAQNYLTQERANLSAKRDADVPAAILELTQTRTNLDAAMSAQARLPVSSLFDFLK